MIQNKDHLYKQLIQLGDMMGDGLHYEPGGKWIPKEYKKILKALGIGPKKKNNLKSINKQMLKRLKDVNCSLCDGILKQTRSGSMRGKCICCSATFQLLKRGKIKGD